MSVRISFVSLKVAQGNKIIMAELCPHKLYLLVRMLWTKTPDHTRWFKYDRDWFVCKQVAQLLRSAACLHTNQSRSYLNHLVFNLSVRYVLDVYELGSHINLRR